MTGAEHRQLLFYAYLWHEESESWPTSACIETGDGRRLEIDVDPFEAEAVVAAAVDARKRVNTQIASGAAPRALAAPEESTCSTCPFRVACDAYWDHVSAVDSRYRHDVRGVVNHVDETGTVT